MADFADDFDEDPEEEGDLGPVLPREDRLWRHPSELSAEDFRSLDPLAVRRRWLQTQPSRASAWTAGVVGALLATGLVVLGTHLGGALTGGVSPPSPSLSSASASSVSEGSPLTTESPILGRFVSRWVARATGSIGAVTIDSDGQHLNELALAVNRAGYFLIPSVHLADSSSILVTLANGVQYVGSVVGQDPSVGVSLLRLNGTLGLKQARFAPSSAPGLAVAIISSSGKAAVTSVGPMRTHPVLAGHRIGKAMAADLPSSGVPVGAILIDGSGRITGMIIGIAHQRVIAVSGADLSAAADLLVGEQGFSEEGLGLTDVSSGSPGARIASVVRGSPGQLAGLEPGDVVVGVDGLTVTSKASFEAALRQASPQASLVLTVEDEQGSRTVVVPAMITSAD